MSAKSEKTREEILAERQEKKKRKAALKNQPKEKGQNSEKSQEKSVKSSAVSVASPADPSPTNKDEKISNTSDFISKSVDKKSKKSDESKKQPPAASGDAEKQVPITLIKTDKSEVKNTELENQSKEGMVKTKAQLKAERRAKQEAERAKKLEKTQGATQEKKVHMPTQPKLNEPVKILNVPSQPVEISHKVKLFAHLYNSVKETDTVDGSVKVHPSIIQLGAQYSSKVVTGANACCLALLNAVKKVVTDFETPPSQEFSRGLEAEISKSMNYLSKCRPLEVSMINAVKHFKFQVNQSKGNELECKNNLNEWIDTYIKEQLEMAAKAICLFVREKITSGDVILTYGCSSLIQQILISTHNEGIDFQVIVVDGRPWLEGREMLRKLVSAGIRCTYVFVNGLSFIMPEVTKILLGAHALLANGYVMARAGSSQIALLAKRYNVPVLVCCETHKFSERVQTDSFVYNELGNPDELVSNKGCFSRELSKWKSIPYLTPLNLTYDVTPPDLVSAVVTEIAVLPCTSVPVILRIKPPDVSC